MFAGGIHCANRNTSGKVIVLSNKYCSWHLVNFPNEGFRRLQPPLASHSTYLEETGEIRLIRMFHILCIYVPYILRDVDLDSVFVTLRFSK